MKALATLLLLSSSAYAQSRECEAKRVTLEIRQRYPQRREPIEQARAALEQCEKRAAENRGKEEERKRAAEDYQREMRERLIAQEEEHARTKAEEDGTMEQTDFRVDALSARLCTDRDLRKVQISEIATQKKYARMTGVINKANLNQVGLRIRALDEAIAAIVGALKSGKATAQPCTKPRVKLIAECLPAMPNGDAFSYTRVAGEGCHDLSVRAAWRILTEE